MKEQWKPVVGYEELYEVSNHGRMRSFDRYRRGINGSRRLCRGKILKATLNDKGYPTVNLYTSGESTSKRTRLVHQLVARAFLGLPPGNEYEINHKNGVKTDSHVSNLEWVTHAQNQAHAGHMGLMPRGTRHPQSKLTPEKVREIRSMHKKGMFHQDIADQFGVSRPTITYLLNGKTWAHVEVRELRERGAQ